MVDLERWKDEIIESITDLHDETKKIREYLEQEDEQEDQDDPEQEVQDVLEQEDQDDIEQEDLDDLEQEDQEDQDDPEQDFQEVIIEKLDDINDSINILNKTVVEGSLVLSITIIIALAFHYFINQISKW